MAVVVLGDEEHLTVKTLNLVEVGDFGRRQVEGWLSVRLIAVTVAAIASLVCESEERDI